jgi:hypothetical protein
LAFYQKCIDRHPQGITPFGVAHYVDSSLGFGLREGYSAQNG